jgi:hypothetical protein
MLKLGCWEGGEESPALHIKEKLGILSPQPEILFRLYIDQHLPPQLQKVSSDQPHAIMLG